LDIIVANDVLSKDAGFVVDTNTVKIQRWGAFFIKASSKNNLSICGLFCVMLCP
jgi:hypothetical protein